MMFITTCHNQNPSNSNKRHTICSRSRLLGRRPLPRIAAIIIKPRDLRRVVQMWYLAAWWCQREIIGENRNMCLRLRIRLIHLRKIGLIQGQECTILDRRRRLKNLRMDFWLIIWEKRGIRGLMEVEAGQQLSYSQFLKLRMLRLYISSTLIYQIQWEIKWLLQEGQSRLNWVTPITTFYF